MSETDTQTEVVTDPNPGSDLSNTTVEPAVDDKAEVESKALRDLQKYKGRVKELEDAQEQSRISKMREKEQWQDLSSEWQQKAEKHEAENKTLKDSMVYDKKYSAVREFALKAGLRNEALRDLELIDFDDVEVEYTSTGRVNVLNAERAVERIKSSRPHWFGNRRTNVNSNEPEVVSGGQVSYNDVYKAEEQARKTGDYAPYKALLNKYKEQRS